MTTEPFGHEAAALMADLAEVGFDVETPARLTGRYDAAVPVLVRWLTRAQATNVRAAIVRALSVPFARKLARKPLLAEFERITIEDDPNGLGLRWTVGNGLEVLYTDTAFEAYRDLALKREYGPARQMLVLGLRKSKRPEVVDLLIKLANDPDVEGQATLALARIADPKAESSLAARLDHEIIWVANEARKGLAKIHSKRNQS